MLIKISTGPTSGGSDLQQLYNKTNQDLALVNGSNKVGEPIFDSNQQVMFIRTKINGSVGAFGVSPLPDFYWRPHVNPLPATDGSTLTQTDKERWGFLMQRNAVGLNGIHLDRLTYRTITLSELTDAVAASGNGLVKVDSGDPVAEYLDRKVVPATNTSGDHVLISTTQDSQDPFGKQLEVGVRLATSGTSSTFGLSGTVAVHGADFTVSAGQIRLTNVLRLTDPTETLQTVTTPVAFEDNVINVPLPTINSHLANKEYVDSRINSLASKMDVRESVAFVIADKVTNFNNMTAPAGQAFSVDMRVLVAGQGASTAEVDLETAHVDNGVYIMSRPDAVWIGTKSTDDFPADTTEAADYLGSIFTATYPSGVTGTNYKGLWMVNGSHLVSGYRFTKVNALDLDGQTLEWTSGSYVQVNLHSKGGLAVDTFSAETGIAVVVVDGGSWT